MTCATSWTSEPPSHPARWFLCPFSHSHVEKLPRREAVFVRALDSMRAEGKEAFGGALLISDRAAARKTAAEQTFSVPNADAKVWELSAREPQKQRTPLCCTFPV